jgi:hypothetical protein
VFLLLKINCERKILMNEAKIFVRERTKMQEKGKKPRFRIVATLGTDLKIKAFHLRKKELEALADAAQAELIFMEDVKDGSGK